MSTLQLTRAKQNNQNSEIQKQETETLRQIDQSCCSSGQVTTAPHWLRWRVCAQVNGSDLTEDDQGDRGRTIRGLVCVLMCVCELVSSISCVVCVFWRAYNRGSWWSFSTFINRICRLDSPLTHRNLPSYPRKQPISAPINRTRQKTFTTFWGEEI